MRTGTRSIEWHEQCLKNMRTSLSDAEYRASRAREFADELRSKVEFYQLQIEEAKRRGMERFDGDRLLKPRKARS